MQELGLLPIAREELEARRRRVAAALGEAGLDALLVATGANIFYLTGLALDGYVWLEAGGRAVWLVKRGMDRVTGESRFAGEIVHARGLKDIGVVAGATFSGRLGLELDTLPVAVGQRLGEVMGARVELVDASELLRNVRSIKSEFEIGCMRTAARRSAAIFRAIPGLLAAGLMEVEAAAEIERLMRREGHPMLFPVHRWGHRFSPLYLCAGPSATLPGTFMGPLGGAGVSGVDPQGCSRRRIERDEPVMVDLCCGERGYLSDQTMTFVVGALADDMMHAHDVSVAIRDEVAAMLRPGTLRVDCWERAALMAREAGLADGFMGLGADRLSFVGHGLGIEIDEQPVLAPRQPGTLAADMVIALEPKFFFPARGAVGVEDTFLVTDSGGERLTKGSDLVEPAR